MQRFLFAAAIALLLPAVSLAQAPLPPNIQTDLSNLNAAFIVTGTQAALVASDSATVTTAQNALALDSGSLAVDEQSQSAALAQAIADLQAYYGTTAPSSSACPTCAKAARANNDDTADLSEAISRGYGSRLAMGPYSGVTLAVRRHVARLNAGTAYVDSDKQFQADLGTALSRTPNPARACHIAEAAVIFLEIAPAFGLNIPNYAQILAIAEQLEAQACSTPVPPTPVPVPPTPVPVPVPVPNQQPHPARHATGLILPPLATRQVEHVKDALRNRAFHSKHGTIVLPASLDYRTTSGTLLALCTQVKDQDGGGTCHDQSGVETVESANIKAGNLTTSQPLSVQSVVDRNPNNDGGCSGGDASSIFQWLTQNGGGIPTVAEYGPDNNACSQSYQLSTTAVGYTLSDWGYADTVTGPAGVQAVKEALVTYGPVSVCIGCPQAFMNYSGGIITYDLSANIDHQIQLIGYVDDATVPGGGYWIVKNSWGTGWGEQGYFRASYASKPTTEAMYGAATAGQTVVVPAGNAPGPGPQPTPTRRMTKLLSDLPALVDSYQKGTPAQKAAVLSLLDAAEAKMKATKQAVGIAQ